MYKIKNLSFTYPSNKTPALQDINLELPSTGLVYLIGESGSGKTTFINVLAGILTNYSGSLTCDKRELSSLSLEEKNDYLLKLVSIANQQDSFEESLTVLENLNVGFDIIDLSKEEKIARIEELSKLLKVDSLLKRKIRELSGGEVKRINLLRALIRDTPVYLLDEPLGPLDERNRIKLTKYFETLSKSHLVVVVTHNVKDISSYSMVVKFNSSRIEEVKVSKLDKEVKPKEKFQRKEASIIQNFIHAFKVVLSKKGHALFTSFACSLALISIGLIFLLTSGITSSLNSIFTSLLTPSTMLIKPKQALQVSNYDQAASFNEFSDIQIDFPEVIGISAYYEINFENIFQNENTVYFLYGGKKLEINSLSGRSFNEFTYYGELADDTSLKNTKLNNDEIYLGLSSQEASRIGSFFGVELGDNPSYTLTRFFISNSVMLHLDLSARSFAYTLENLFLVKGVEILDTSRIIHTDPMFNEYFVETNMTFISHANQGQTSLDPWNVFKAYMVLVSYSDKQRFLSDISFSLKYKNLSLELIKEEESPSYFKDDVNCARLKILKDQIGGVKKADVSHLLNPYETYIENLVYSDGFYYFSEDGLTSGFLHPVYVSNKKEKLNEIADYNYEASFDLQGFQGSSIIPPDGVIAGDISSLEENPLIFQVNKADDIYLAGGKAQNYSEVCITSSLANELFTSPSQAVNKTLYITCLSEIEYKQDGYKNVFKDGEFKIAGVVESKDNALVHDSLFLSSIGEEMFDFGSEDKAVDKCIVNFKLGYEIQNIVNNFNSEYLDYSFTLPLQEVEADLNEMVSYIATFLYFFAFFTSLIAMSLLSVTGIMFIDEDESKIAVWTSLGYRIKDLKKYYAVLISLLSSSGSFAALISLVIVWKMFSFQLTNILGQEVAVFAPLMYVSVVVFALLFTFLSIGLANRKLNKIAGFKNKQ